MTEKEKTKEELQEELTCCQKRLVQYSQELHQIIRMSITDLKQLKECKEQMDYLDMRYKIKH